MPIKIYSLDKPWKLEDGTVITYLTAEQLSAWSGNTISTSRCRLCRTTDPKVLFKPARFNSKSHAIKTQTSLEKKLMGRSAYDPMWKLLMQNI
jgi:hypothetical protein